jgi:hypothetical protein
MLFQLLDTVVLDRDLPEHGLRAGDLGAIVEVRAPDGLETSDVRAVADRNILTVRASWNGLRRQRRSPSRS